MDFLVWKIIIQKAPLINNIKIAVLHYKFLVMLTKKYNKKGHISQEEREEISKMLYAGESYRAIWRSLGRHHTTIMREIERNSLDLWYEKIKYSPWKAQIKYEERRQKANKNHCKLIKNARLRNKLIGLLDKYGEYRWPDEIIHRLEAEIGKKLISTSTIYRYFRWYGKKYEKYLRFKGYGYRKRGTKGTWWKYQDVPYIDERNFENTHRTEIGHFECDTIVNPKWIKWGLVTIVDRKSRYLLMMKVKDLKWETVYWAMKYLLYWEEVKSLIIDNWVEFSKIRKFQKAWIKIYRCHAYSSREKGSNERNNGLVRKQIPKKYNINEYTNEEIQKITNMINHKPRKELWYKSAYEVYHNKKLHYCL